MSKVDSSKLTDAIRVLVTVVLGGIGGAAGFTHTHDWAVHHGQTGWLAWADAVVIEGIAIVAGFEVRRDHQRGNPRKLTFPLLVLIAGFGIQMTAQVALAEPTPSGWLLAAMPALGFLVVVKLLLRRAPADREPAPAESRPTPEPESVKPAPAPPAASASDTTAQVLPRLKLPAPMAERIHAAANEARQAGRQLTPADVQAVVKVPDDLAARIVADLATVNGHSTV
ncbi:DUF2637 domain-containing protein [Amycolatopsis sacchari]|uniref:DUF2637 domain-containing protein n=1 Tax=Amycolatopsis sacchari TaxID=115433 RepID=UPI003D75B4CA